MKRIVEIRMTSKGNVALLCVGLVLALPAAPLYAQASGVTYGNPDGSKSLTGVAGEDGFDFAYQETGGYSADFVMSDDGTLTIGDLVLSGVQTGVFGTQHTFNITVNWGGQTASTSVTVDELSGEVIGNPDVSDIRALIYGQVSPSLDGLVFGSSEFEFAHKLDVFLTGDVAQEATLKSWACWSNVLGGVGTGVAFGVCCGGGCAGPWYRAACGGAVAAYAGMLIKIASTC